MIILYIISVFLLLGATLKPQKQNLYFYISFILLFIFSAFRAYSVGTDTEHYLKAFNILESGGLMFMEPFWVSLNKLVLYFGGNFRYILVVSSFLVLFPVFYVVLKSSKNAMLSIFLYFVLYIYLQSLNITREMIAVSIVFLGAFFIVNKRKPFLYIVLVLFASLFHISALIALPIVFVDRIPNRRIIYIGAVLVSMCVGLFFIGPFSNEMAKILGYSNHLANNKMGNLLGNSLFLFILNSFFIFILITSYNGNTLFKLFFIYVVSANLVARVPLGSRSIFYFSIFQILFFPYYIYNNKFKDPVIPVLLVVAYSYILFIRFTGAGEIIPYTNILFK